MFSNLKSKLNTIIVGFTLGGTVLTYQSWFDRIQDLKSELEKNKVITDMKDVVDEIKKIQVVSNNKSDDNYHKINENLHECNNSIQKMEELLNITKVRKIEGISEVSNGEDVISDESNIVEGISEISNKIELDLNTEFNEIGQLLRKVLSRMEDIEKYLNDKNKKIFDINSIKDLIKDFNEYLSTLSIYQLCVLMDLLLIVLIFTCLINILFAFYGNYFITKLSLEQKFPKLSFIIKLRIKFQHYYIISNSLFIFIVLILMAYVNLMTLINV